VNHREFEPPLDERIEDLKHRLRVEAAVVEGAKNVIKLLQNGSKDKSDKKLLSEVSGACDRAFTKLPSCTTCAYCTSTSSRV
jgi:predicted aldo/keto reductase-like oxidoreductase